MRTGCDRTGSDQDRSCWIDAITTLRLGSSKRRSPLVTRGNSLFTATRFYGSMLTQTPRFPAKLLTFFKGRF